MLKFFKLSDHEYHKKKYDQYERRSYYFILPGWGVVVATLLLSVGFWDNSDNIVLITAGAMGTATCLIGYFFYIAAEFHSRMMYKSLKNKEIIK